MSYGNTNGDYGSRAERRGVNRLSAPIHGAVCGWNTGFSADVSGTGDSAGAGRI